LPELFARHRHFAVVVRQPGAAFAGGLLDAWAGAHDRAFVDTRLAEIWGFWSTRTPRSGRR
jgi:hypothetical protein